MAKKSFRESKNFKMWLKNAHQDLEVAFLLNREKSYTDTICYFCHQSVEKAIKAYLLSKSVLDFPHIHDLISLLKQAEEYSPEFGSLESKVRVLNRYYIETKYPPDFPVVYSRNEASRALEMTANIYQLIEKKLKSEKRA